MFLRFCGILKFLSHLIQKFISGKVAVTSVLSQRDNLRCLMPFVEHTGKDASLHSICQSELLANRCLMILLSLNTLDISDCARIVTLRVSG